MSLFIFNSMEAWVRPQVSCCLINDNHQVENERFGRNRKIQSTGHYDCVQLFMCMFALIIFVGVCVRDMLNILCAGVFLTVMKT